MRLKQSDTPSKSFRTKSSGLSLHVNDDHYNAMQIRALYESERYPLSRKRT